MILGEKVCLVLRVPLGMVRVEVDVCSEHQETGRLPTLKLQRNVPVKGGSAWQASSCAVVTDARVEDVVA